MSDQQKAIRVAIIGSSTAEGVGASDRGNAWAHRFERFLSESYPGSSVLNLGRAGMSSFQILPDGAGPFAARPIVDAAINISKALDFHPQAVVVNLASNDTVSGHSVEEQILNLKTIARMAQRFGVLVWVFTTQPRNLPFEQVETQRAVRNAILQEFGPFALDVWAPLADEKGWLRPEFDCGDGTHLNNTGHAVIYELVLAQKIPDAIAAQFKNNNRFWKRIQRLFRWRKQRRY